MSYLFLARGRHTAQNQTETVRVYYPYHPQFEKEVRIIVQKKHQGEEHAVIEQPDNSYAFLPYWMLRPEAKQHSLVVTPCLPLTVLHDLQYFINSSFSSKTSLVKVSLGEKHEAKKPGKTRTIRIISHPHITSTTTATVSKKRGHHGTKKLYVKTRKRKKGGKR